ncbi:MAG: hypothetical protein LC772_05275, partial [Chloroflexi bacterium]|nr:hypothetical protein [Chloroflexota bacterium]
MNRFLGLTAALLVLSAGLGSLVYLRRHPREPDQLAARNGPTAMASRYRIILKREILSFTSLRHDGPIQGSGYVG